MMFVKIDYNTYVNLEKVNGIILEEHSYTYHWAFWVSDGEPFLSSPFQSKEEALKWFQENIEPAIKDFNNAKFAPYEMISTLEDINSNLYDLLERQEA